MGRQSRNVKGKRVTVVEPNLPTCPPSVSQETWNQIFPGRAEFQAKYGHMIRGKITAQFEEYEYKDKNDGTIKTVRFARKP